MQSVLPMRMHVPAYVCVSGLLVQLSTMCMSCLYWMQGVTDWDRTQKRLCLQISVPGVIHAICVMIWPRMDSGQSVALKLVTCAYWASVAMLAR